MERSRNSLFCAVSEIGMISYGGTWLSDVSMMGLIPKVKVAYSCDQSEPEETEELGFKPSFGGWMAHYAWACICHLGSISNEIFI